MPIIGLQGNAVRLIDQLGAAGVVGPAIGANPREILIKSPKELFGDDWDKSNRKDKDEENSSKDHFAKIYFWLRVIKLSLVILVPYILFGLEAGLLVGIIVIALFLSKISVMLFEINEFFQKTIHQ